MVKIYANPSFHSRCSHLVNSKRTRKLSPLSKRPHLRRTKIESGGGTSHVLPTARYCLMNDSRNQKNKEKKRKKKTQRHSMVSVLIGFTDGMYKSNLLILTWVLDRLRFDFPSPMPCIKNWPIFAIGMFWGEVSAAKRNGYWISPGLLFRVFVYPLSSAHYIPPSTFTGSGSSCICITISLSCSSCSIYVYLSTFFIDLRC